MTKNTRSKHSGDTKFNVENPSNAKGKNHGRQPANTPHYYQELGYNAIWRLTRSYLQWNLNLGICTGPPLRFVRNRPLQCAIELETYSTWHPQQIRTQSHDSPHGPLQQTCLTLLECSKAARSSTLSVHIDHIRPRHRIELSIHFVMTDEE